MMETHENYQTITCFLCFKCQTFLLRHCTIETRKRHYFEAVPVTGLYITQVRLVRTCLATALAKSLLVSVLPVPAGPSGAPPKCSWSAPISVLQQPPQLRYSTTYLVIWGTYTHKTCMCPAMSKWYYNTNWFILYTLHTRACDFLRDHSTSTCQA